MYGQPADVQAFVVLAVLLLGDLTRPQAAVWYESLLAESGYGRLSREHAAFLIREADGTLTLEPWARGSRRHATYRGTVPVGAIAILHTHPHGEPSPSAQDRAEAKRLGMPVVVITTEKVIAALPDGSEVLLERRRPAG